MGKKAISDLTPFDMLFTVIIGAAVSEPVYDSSVSIWQIIDKGYRLDEIYFGEMRANGELFLITYDELIHDQEQAEKKIDK